MSETANTRLNDGESIPVARKPASLGLLAKRYFARFDDGELMRAAFYGLLVGSVTVLATDLFDLYQHSAAQQMAAPLETSSPLLPPVFETDGPLPKDPRSFVTGDQDSLRQPMRFTLEPDGVLRAEGAIDEEASKRLSEELAARGEYVRTVSLNSPGGALQQAIAMSELLRERKLNTEVADGAICASSCPLIFAGGKERRAGMHSAIGVHQFYATAPAAGARLPDPAQALSEAQMTTARISRHLTDMGVDPSLWLHAMDTPPQALYYFTPEELRTYRLATGVARASSAALPADTKLRPAG